VLLLNSLARYGFERSLLTALVSFITLWAGAWLVLAVWPRIRAVLGGAAPFADGKPELSVDQYSPLLRAALQSVVEGEAEVAKLAETLDNQGSSDMLGYLQRQSLFFEQVNARRVELEAVRPEHRLQAVHTEAVKFLRCYLKVMNASAGSLAAAVQGNFVESRRLRTEADSWSPTLATVSRKLAAALRRLEVEQPTLFALLQLQPTLVAELEAQSAPAT
jgi:hypothetical protein